MDPFIDEDRMDLLGEEEETSHRWPDIDELERNRNSTKMVAGFSTPLSWKWFVSVVGTEYCHTYFWIAKDLAWMQGLRTYSIFFGLLALGWSLVILFHALRTVNWHEIWNFVALFLWLLANFIWMRGEAHDHAYPKDRPIASECTQESALILTIAFVWLMLYYCIFLPFNLIYSSKASLLEYDDGQLRPRCSIFRNFRQYENLHMLFWISKDLAWNRLNLSLWLICLIPTIVISADLFIIAVTSNSSEYIVDVTHFGVTLIWVAANSVWAFGDFFIEKYDKPLGIWDSSEETLMTARWYAAWILCFDISVVVIMYGVWLILTLSGKLSSPVDSVDAITHKHSMTGLNLSGGNGLLSYMDGGSNATDSSPPSSTIVSASRNAKYSAYAYAVGIFQRNLSGGGSGTAQQSGMQAQTQAQTQAQSPPASGIALSSYSSDS